MGLVTFRNLINLCIINGESPEPWIVEKIIKDKVLLRDFLGEKSARIKSKNKITLLKDISFDSVDGPVNCIKVMDKIHNSSKEILESLNNYDNLSVQKKLYICNSLIPGFRDNILKLSTIYDVYISLEKYWHLLFSSTPIE